MILCARSTWRSREQSTTCSEDIQNVCLFYSQINKIVWLSNMADTFSRCANVCGLFFSSLSFTDADWLGRQIPITSWKLSSSINSRISSAQICWREKSPHHARTRWRQLREGNVPFNYVNFYQMALVYYYYYYYFEIWLVLGKISPERHDVFWFNKYSWRRIYSPYRAVTILSSSNVCLTAYETKLT